MRKFLMVLLMALMLTSQVMAFNFFGLKLFEKPLVWASQPNFGATGMAQEKRLEHQPIVEVPEAIALINADERAAIYLGDFEGEKFCIITDVRQVYATVNNSKVVQLLDRPASCHEIRVKEGYAIGVMKRYQAHEYIPASEVLQNTQTSLTLKLKAMEIRANRMKVRQ